MDEKAWTTVLTEAGIEEESAKGYASLFAKERLSCDLLGDLDRSMLKELGVDRLGDALTMSIQSVSKVLAQGIGISIILIIALHIIFNILSSIITGQYEENIEDERDKIYELYALQMSSAIFGISIVATFILLGWFNLNIITGLIAITFSGFIASILSLVLKLYLYR